MDLEWHHQRYLGGRWPVHAGKGFEAGMVTVTLKDVGDVVLDFDINPNCDLAEWHLWASDETPCPHTGFNDWYKGEVDYAEIELDMPLMDADGDGSVFIAFHSEVCCPCSMEIGCEY